MFVSMCCVCECDILCLLHVGIAYHHYRPNAFNQSEIYVSLDSGEIRKLTVAVVEEVDFVNLTAIGNDSLVYSVSEGYELGRLSVDWVNNILHWVEKNEQVSVTHRLTLDGGVPEQVGMPLLGEIRDIFPDPIHG